MSAVQLLRVSVHERIRAAAEHFLLRLEKGEEPARVPALRAMLTERLTAEIVAVFEETVAEYEDRVERSEREVCRQRRLLDAVMKPEVRLHRAGSVELVWFESLRRTRVFRDPRDPLSSSDELLKDLDSPEDEPLAAAGAQQNQPDQ
ncbi:unnamed protein product [Pleuronectes platessa]|uniref:Uncharacterized protein n=1 Tax=Pleuronectes platessa TaxID=8262 RepID=A0A9N7U7J7_PLEPL|nr:unnamed protein product [Pleuronectes platessa]